MLGSTEVCLTFEGVSDKSLAGGGVVIINICIFFNHIKYNKNNIRKVIIIYIWIFMQIYKYTLPLHDNIHFILWQIQEGPDAPAPNTSILNFFLTIFISPQENLGSALSLSIV